MKKQKKLFTATFTHQGKRIYVRSSVSQRDAEKKAAKKQAELETGLNLISEKMTVQQYAMMWVETYKKNTVSRTTYVTYVGRLKNYILPKIGSMCMNQVKPTHLQGVLNSAPGMSKDFYEKMQNHMYQMFDRAVKDGIILRNPADDLKIPKATNGTHRSITEAERRAILIVAQTNYIGPIVRTMLACGLRPQEAWALRWENVDMINHILHIKNAVKRDGYIGEPKSKAGIRNIPIPPSVWDIFSSPGKLDEFVFVQKNGNHYGNSTFRQYWYIFLKHVDVELGAEYIKNGRGINIINSVVAKDLTPYCLRHTYCTDLEAAGVPINVAKYLMGHSTLAITAQIYTHMRDDIFEQATRQVATISQDIKPLISATVGATPKGQIRVSNGK